MSGKRTFVVLMLGTVGLTLAANRLLSFQLDAQGVKGALKAWWEMQAAELSVSGAVRERTARLADQAVDEAIPLARELGRTLDALAGDSSTSAVTADTSQRIQCLYRNLSAFVDLKDKFVSQAGKSLTPKERAELIVKVGSRIRTRTGLTPDTVESLLETVRDIRETRLHRLLGLGDGRATALKQRIDRFANGRKSIRQARRAVFAKLETAISKGGSRVELASILSEWDNLTVRSSNLTREQISEAQKFFTPNECIRLARAAHQRIEQAAGVLALIARFHPVD